MKIRILLVLGSVTAKIHRWLDHSKCVELCHVQKRSCKLMQQAPKTIYGCGDLLHGTKRVSKTVHQTWTVENYKTSPSCKEICASMRQVCTITNRATLPKDLIFGCVKKASSGRRHRKGKNIWTEKDVNKEPTCKDTCAQEGKQCFRLRGPQHGSKASFSCGRPSRRGKGHHSPVQAPLPHAEATATQSQVASTPTQESQLSCQQYNGKSLGHATIPKNGAETFYTLETIGKRQTCLFDHGPVNWWTVRPWFKTPDESNHGLIQEQVAKLKSACEYIGARIILPKTMEETQSYMKYGKEEHRNGMKMWIDAFHISGVHGTEQNKDTFFDGFNVPVETTFFATTEKFIRHKLNIATIDPHSSSGSWTITHINEMDMPSNTDYTLTTTGIKHDSAVLHRLVCERDPVSTATTTSENDVDVDYDNDYY